MGVKRLLVGAAFAATCFSAQAFVLGTGVTPADNNTEAFTWSFDTSPGAFLLTGSGSMTASGFGTNTLSLVITLTNSTVTTDATGKDARLTSFGFAIDPDTGAVTFTDAADGGLVDAALASIPSLALIEVCAFGGNNCPGGSNGGIYGDGTGSNAGEDTFTLLLTKAGGGNWGNSVTIDPLGWKYQTSGGSYEFYGSSSSRIITSGPVPEPGTLSLIGGAILAGLFKARQKRQRAE
ncbi:MAG: cistern family PEP-CTERM protein [Zoogloeaceae bacterium]|nr:cistern family PEP-CTERM protein [Zoogloeaceae bacterium]